MKFNLTSIKRKTNKYSFFQKSLIKRCVLIYLLAIGMIIISSHYLLLRKPTFPVSTSDFDEAVELISRLRSNYSSLHGLRYRSMICTLSRNDYEIAEFILRNIISGFSHIVIYDNNRIFAGYDLNITAILQPFIAAGVVTYVPWEQNTTDLFTVTDQRIQSNHCINTYGKHADWLAYLDTDEYFYFEKQKVSVNTLNDLLVEIEKYPLCAVTIWWTYMYGEARMLKTNRTLFESYPRICTKGARRKVLGKPSSANFSIHGVKCKDGSKQRSWIWKSRKGEKLHLIHYYSKSMEEFLMKVDQSMPPYIRHPLWTYTKPENICRPIELGYSKDFRHVFLSNYKKLEMLHSLTPIVLRPMPGLITNETMSNELISHLKYRCSKGEEFDKKRYLKVNPGAMKAIRNRTYSDGLHHFLDNFGSGVTGCWKTNTYSICEYIFPNLI